MVEVRTEKGRRRRFGSVYTLRRGDGTVISWVARYRDPVTRKRVERHFGPKGHVAALAFLEQEEMLVRMHRAGVQEYVHPSERNGRSRGSEWTFDRLCDWYVERHRKPDGSPLRGAAARNLRADVSHLRRAFGSLRLREVTAAVISDWYFGPHEEGLWAFQRACQRMKSIMRDACSPGVDGSPALLLANPWSLPIPPDPTPGSWLVPPVSSETLRKLYDAFPEYTRISVLLAAWAGGMRIGEVCALRVDSFDLERKVMHVTGSVNHGPDDLGPSRVGETKTSNSVRTVVLPDLLVPLIREHLEHHDPSNPMFFQAKAGTVLSRSTLQSHMERARRKVGCEGVTFRTLRVTHATLFMQAGGTLREAMDQIGDQTEEVLVRHYLRSVPEHQRDVANRMAEEMAQADPALAIRMGLEPVGDREKKSEEAPEETSVSISPEAIAAALARLLLRYLGGAASDGPPAPAGPVADDAGGFATE